MPYLPDDQRFEVVPDWICEILSPSTASKDRAVKMPLYARYGVRYAWLIDPAERTLEVYRLDAGAWVEAGCFARWLRRRVFRTKSYAIWGEKKGFYVTSR